MKKTTTIKKLLSLSLILFTCGTLSAQSNDPTIAYAVLKDKLDGTFYTTTNGRLHFKYEEKYIEGTLNYKIYDWQHNEIAVSATLNRKYGINWYTLDLTGVSGLSAGNYYTLQVTNDKNEILYLRFKFQ